MTTWGAIRAELGAHSGLQVEQPDGHAARAKQVMGRPCASTLLYVLRLRRDAANEPAPNAAKPPGVGVSPSLDLVTYVSGFVRAGQGGIVTTTKPRGC